MLGEALTALATAGGTSLVTAAGTEAWAGMRKAVGGWFGRGDPQRERAELERLDQTAAALESADGAEAERARIRQEAIWQARIEFVLESLEETERAEAADRLRALLARHSEAGGVSAGAGGLAVGGDVNIRAEGGSIAGGVIHGGARLGPPTTPDPSQG